MKIRNAALVGIILVIANLVIRLYTHGFFLLCYLPILLRGSGPETLWLGGQTFVMVGAMVGDIVLSAALLLVFGSLSRTREQSRDKPNVPA
jgi:hypothetical protein